MAAQAFKRALGLVKQLLLATFQHSSALTVSNLLLFWQRKRYKLYQLIYECRKLNGNPKVFGQFSQCESGDMVAWKAMEKNNNTIQASLSAEKFAKNNFS